MGSVDTSESSVVEELVCAEDADDDADSWDGYEPTISDRLHVGYYRMDRACQTEESDLVNLKQLSDLLAIVGNDITLLNKSLCYAKLTLQAEYDGRLHDELAALNSRVNSKITELEGKHRERIDVLRRSYRTQLSNALCKLSRDYHRYYGQKDADTKANHNEKLSELEKEKAQSRKNELLHKEMAEMLKLQADDENISEEEEVDKDSVNSTSRLAAEMEDLNHTVTALESKIEYLEEMLEETNTDNIKLNEEVDDLATNLADEEKKTTGLQEEVSTLREKIIKERFAAQERLNQQKEKLKGEMDSKLRSTREKMQEESAKHMEDIKKKEADKLVQHKLEDEKKLQELMVQQQEEVVPVEVVVDHDTALLQQIQENQEAEIAKLKRELERKAKLWEMKVKVLQEHIHVLKDEMFLRSTLQRQSAKMRQAGLTYAKVKGNEGGQDIPLGVNPVEERQKLERKHRLPTIIQGPKVVVCDPCADEVNTAKVIANYCK